MTPQRTYADYLADIIDAIEKLSAFTEGYTYQQFKADEKTCFAVVRALEIVGEATKNIPIPVRDKFPDIPWRSMAGMRDKLSHQYFGVNIEVVWKTATKELPKIKSKLQEILRNAEKL